MTTQELKVQRLRMESKALDAAQRDLRDVNGRISVLEQHMADLALSLSAAREWRSGVLSRCETLREHLAVTQRAVSPIGMCPDDVLRAIFVQYTQEYDPEWVLTGMGFFNPVRAAAPFSVAAVCNSWRRLALSTPTIWSYVGVPPLNKSPAYAESFVTRIRTVLVRSCAAPLDVFFEDVHAATCTAYRDILELLYPHIHRWRRFELWSPAPFPLLHTFLRGRAPLLEELCVHVYRTREWTADPAPLLTGLTRLRELRLGHTSIVLLTTNISTLESLTFDASLHMPSAAFWTLLGCARYLKYLSLGVDDWSVVETAMPQTVDFPKVTHLILRNRATSILVHYATRLSMPALRELELYAVPRDDAVCLTRILHNLTSSTRFANIRSLALSEPNTALSIIDAQHLGKLDKLIRLVVTKCPTVDSGFWTGLATAPSFLTLLRLENVTMTPDSIEALLAMVRSWHSSPRRRSTLKVSIDPECNLTNRDRAELRAIM